MGMPTKENALIEHVRKFEYHAGEILKRLGSTAPEEQPELITIIETTFRQFWSRLVGDNDLRNKREVYEQISAFLSKHFSMPPPHVCMHVCLQLCEETDAALWEANKLNQHEMAQAMELLPKAKDLIVAIKVRFEPSSETACVRRTEIWHVRGQNVVSTTSEIKMTWEDLPADVRADYLKERTKAVLYKLYPKE